MYKKIFDSLLKLFIKNKGHSPGTYELRKIKDQTESIMKQREKTAPFEGFKPKIVGKDKKVGIEELIEGKPYKDKRGRTWQFDPTKKKVKWWISLQVKRNLLLI